MIDDKESHVYVTPRLSANTYEIILDAVLKDCGVARLPSYVIRENVENKKLKILIADRMPAEIPIYAIYAQNIHMPPITRVFIEFLQNIMQ